MTRGASWHRVAYELMLIERGAVAGVGDGTSVKLLDDMAGTVASKVACRVAASLVQAACWAAIAFIAKDDDSASKHVRHCYGRVTT